MQWARKALTAMEGEAHSLKNRKGYSSSGRRNRCQWERWKAPGVQSVRHGAAHGLPGSPGTDMARGPRGRGRVNGFKDKSKVVRARTGLKDSRK